jgi:hypothetical protein
VHEMGIWSHQEKVNKQSSTGMVAAATVEQNQVHELPSLVLLQENAKFNSLFPLFFPSSLLRRRHTSRSWIALIVKNLLGPCYSGPPPIASAKQGAMCNCRKLILCKCWTGAQWWGYGCRRLRTGRQPNCGCSTCMSIGGIASYWNTSHHGLCTLKPAGIHPNCACATSWKSIDFFTVFSNRTIQGNLLGASERSSGLSWSVDPIELEAVNSPQEEFFCHL